MALSNFCVPLTDRMIAQSFPIADQRSGAPAATGVLSGSVTDPSGAKIPHAAIHIDSAAGQIPTLAAFTHDITADASGSFTLALPSGSYDITIFADGFNPVVQTVSIAAGARLAPLAAKLTIATQAEEVDVASNSETSTASAENKSALVFKSKDLDALSPDDATFQQELTAMAGGGQGGASIYVDRFSGGAFPPKDTIREVRINQNPFSAQYEDLGYGRIEIFTKPGTDKWHGSFNSNGNGSTRRW